MEGLSSFASSTSTREVSSLQPAAVKRVAAALSDQIALLYEVRPLDPQARFDGSILSFSYQGGLSPADESLIESGHAEELRIFREAFFESVADQLGSVVAALTGAPVAFFSTAFDAASRRTHCYFTLAHDPGSTREQRRAILAWSEQVRRNTQDLRNRHVQAREVHRRLHTLLREALEESDRD